MGLEARDGSDLHLGVLSPVTFLGFFLTFPFLETSQTLYTGCRGTNSPPVVRCLGSDVPRLSFFEGLFVPLPTFRVLEESVRLSRLDSPPVLSPTLFLPRDSGLIPVFTSHELYSFSSSSPS